MNIEEFVSESLKQLISGVKAAQEHAAQLGAIINPVGIRFRAGGGVAISDTPANTVAGTVDFDIGVTVTEGSQKKGGAGLHVASVGFGVQGQTESSNQSVSRIKFSVPVVLPRGSVPRDYYSASET